MNAIENNLILELNNLYPFGLHYRLDAQKTFNENGCIFKLFSSFKRKERHSNIGSKVNKGKIYHDLDVLLKSW